MGYRSQIALKTTTEGYVLFKRFNDSITDIDEQPLSYMDIQKTESGFYKISHDDLKWYETYPDVKNFIHMLDEFDEQEIPYVFIRIGEGVDDIEVRENYTEDMPEEIISFKPETSIYDENEGDYESIKED